MHPVSHWLSKIWLTFRAIVYQLRHGRTESPFELSQEEEKRPTPWQIWRGKLLRQRFGLKERFLWQRYELREETNNWRLLRQTLSRGRKLLLELILLTITGILFDFALATAGIQTIPSLNNTILEIVKVYVGAIAAILGLFFALYTVGFQVSTQDYSQDVSEFINSEKVTSFFFQLLLFALVYNLLTILRLWFLPLPAFSSLVISTGLSITALVSILIYKSHHLLASRPDNVFFRIRAEFNQSLRIVSNNTSASYKSVSLSARASRGAREMSNLAWTLYSDLLRKQDLRMAKLGPYTVALMLRDYMAAKDNIRKEHSYWFPNENREIDRNDLALGTLARSYSLQGKGVATFPTPNYEWLERLLLNTLANMIKAMQKTTEDSLYGVLLSGSIKTYCELLVGDFSHGEFYRQQHNDAGLIGLQTYEVFEVALKQFLDLWEFAASDEQARNDYLNSLYLIGYVLIEGIDPLEIDRVSQLLFVNNRLADSEEIRRGKIPHMMREVLTEAWRKLNNERQIEGSSITPADLIQRHLANEIQGQEQRFVNSCFQYVLNQSNVCLRTQIDSVPTVRFHLDIVKLQLSWIKATFQNSRDSLLGLMVSIFTTDLNKDLVTCEENSIRELHFHEDVEDIMYFSLLHRSKDIFNAILHPRIFIYINLLNSCASHEQRQFLDTLLMGGGLAFALSEFEQDSCWVDQYAAITRKIFKDQTAMIDTFKLLDKTSFSLIESIQDYSYYDHWFKQLRHEIEQLPVDYTERGYMGMIPVAKYRHPSLFINHFSPDHITFHFRESCTEGFIQWLNDHLMQTPENPPQES